MTSSQANILGCGDTVNFEATANCVVWLYDTNNSWDNVYGSNGVVAMTSSQANVIGGGNTINFEGSTGCAAWLYDTNGSWDSVYGSNGVVAMTGSQANVIGNSDTIDISGNAGSLAALFGTSDALAFLQPAFGQDVVAGFGSSDTIQFSATDFANFTALHGAMTQSGANTVIKLDATDMVTLQNVTMANLTAAQFKFV
jgi:hypothetical protein